MSQNVTLQMNLAETIVAHILDLETLWKFIVLFPEVSTKSFYSVIDDGRKNNYLRFKDEAVIVVDFRYGQKIEETAYRRKKKNGPHREFGKKISIEGRYLNDKKVERWVYKYPSGIVSDEGEYVNNDRNGLWTGKYDSGERRYESVLSSGVMNGMHRNYFYDGNLQMEGRYVDGLQEGYWKYFYSNGVIRSEGHFIHGKIEGEWIGRTEDNKVSGTKYYNGGF